MTIALVQPGALETLSTAVLVWIGQALLFGTVVALLTWLLLTTLLRGTRPTWHVIFWVVVLLKFVLPAGPGSELSLASLVGRAIPAPMERTVEPTAVAAHTRATGATLRGELIPVTARELPVAQHDDPPPALAARVLPPLVGLYALGVLLVVAGRWRAHHRFARYCATRSPADPNVRLLVRDACRRLGVRNVPDVRVTDDPMAPFVFGMLRPMLVLSRSHIHDRDELEAVVLHEIAHLRRGDLWVRCLQGLAGVLLFFWPVVAWVNRRIDLAREHACDEWALRCGRLRPERYARCLLRALQARGTTAATLTATAMAANRVHVLRRIDMILDTRRQSSNALGVAAGGLLLLWAGFVLTGASAQTEEPVVVQTADAVIELQSAEDGAVAHGDGALMLWQMDGLPMLPNLPFLPFGGNEEFVFETVDGEAPMIFMAHAFNELHPDSIEEHPAADADGDGNVTPTEFNAYLVALAMIEPAAVLEQYNKADRDADGALSALEAAQLVTGGLMHTTIPMPGRVAQRVHLGDGHAGQPRMVTMLRESDGAVMEWQEAGVELETVAKVEGGTLHLELKKADGTVENQVIELGNDGERETGRVQVFRTDDGRTVKFMEAAPAVRLPEPPVAWILRNLTGAPTPDEVAGYIPVTEEAPLVTFLELNPTADTNNDGRLTVEERDAFVEQHTSRMRERMLERHPEADLNGDGLLTPDEMHEFFRSQHQGATAPGAFSIAIEKTEEGPDGHQVQVEWVGAVEEE